MAARLAGADIRMLQMLLTLRGYSAGSVDGIAGLRTRDALHAMQLEHCLDEGPDLGPLIPILTAPEVALTPAPCAP